MEENRWKTLPPPEQWPQAVLFDWDGTILDSLHIFHEATCLFLDKLGLPPLDITHYDKGLHLPIRDLVSHMFPERLIENVTDRWIRCVKEIGARYPLSLRPGARDLIHMLHCHNVPMAIISNKEHALLHEEVESFGLSHYFGMIIGAEYLPESKPSPLPVITALRHLRVPSPHEDPAADVWFIGDSYVDMHVAEKTGCLPVFIGQLRHLAHFEGNLWMAETPTKIWSWLASSVETPWKACLAPHLMPHVVLFDWDGTLIDSDALLREVSHQFAQEIGINVIESQPIRESLPSRFARLFPPAQATILYHRFVQHIQQSGPAPLQPHGRDLISSIRAQGVKLGIVSNKPHTDLMQAVQAHGLGPLFDIVVGSGISSADKPSPAPIYTALQGLGMMSFKPDEVWFVGDSFADMKAAEAALCTAVFVGDAYRRSGLTPLGFTGTLWDAGGTEGLWHHWRDLIRSSG